MIQIKKVENYKLEKLLKKIKPYIKMNKIFDETKIWKYKFHQYKSPVLIENIDFNKIVVSNNSSIFW